MTEKVWKPGIFRTFQKWNVYSLWNSNDIKVATLWAEIAKSTQLVERYQHSSVTTGNQQQELTSNVYDVSLTPDCSSLP